MTNESSTFTGRAAAEEAIRRAAAGVTGAKEGLSGLGREPDGSLPIGLLVHPSWIGAVPELAWLRAIDWFIEGGVDAASVFERAISFQFPAIARHLVRGGALSDKDSALDLAVRARLLGVARELVAQGADPRVLADVVRPDLVTPAGVEVRYRASAEEQRVRFAVTLAVPPGGGERQETIVRYRATLLQRLGAGGTLGGDVFSPRASRVAQVSFAAREVSEGRVEGVSELAVRGVAPAGLALVFRSMISSNGLGLTAGLELEGELAPDGGPASVDTARALRWFSDTAADPVLPFASPGITIEAKPKKKTFAVVEHAAGRARDVMRALGPLDVEVLSHLPAVGLDLAVPAAAEHFDSKPGDTKTEVLVKRFAATRAPQADRALLRTMFAHAMAAVDGVSLVRWGDDAGLPASEAPAVKPAPEKKAAKKKAAPALTIVETEAGPSLLEQARAALAMAKAPWAGRGFVARGATTFEGGEPLPPSVAAWLAFGDEDQPFDREAPLSPRPFSALLRAHFAAAAEVAEAFEPLEKRLLPGGCVPLFTPSICSDGAFLFLYLPLRDPDGEPPVLGFDFTDDGLVGVFAPRFDFYLARVLGARTGEFAFGGVPGTGALLEALVKLLPAKLRKAVQGNAVIPVGSLVG